MSVQGVLRDVKALLSRAHFQDTVQGPHATKTAVDGRGNRVRPLSSQAVKWDTAGAVQRVAPARSAHDETVWGDSTAIGDEAYELLEEVARSQGYRNVHEVDAAGWPAVSVMLTRAIDLAPDEKPRRRKAGGVGALPRGSEAA